MKNLFRLFLVLLVTLLFISPVMAKPKYFFKIGSLAPEGSVWVEQFNRFTEEITEKTGGEVGFRIYPGGVMGDDQTMYQKIRAGQLHGAGFTMTGIAAIVPDFRVMSVPFFFDTYEEVDFVTRGLTPHFKEKFAQKRMKYLAINEVGFIYTMSAAATTGVEELQKSKAWAPSGDPVATQFLSCAGINPIQLTIPDVLSSLQTGLVDTVFNSLYGSIVLQWYTKAKHVTDTPFGYAYGAFVMDNRAFSKLPEKYALIVEEAAVKHFDILLDQTRKSNEESRQVLMDQGVTFTAPDPQAVEQLKSYRDKTVTQLVGTAFSEEVYTSAMALRKEYRNKESK